MLLSPLRIVALSAVVAAPFLGPACSGDVREDGSGGASSSSSSPASSSSSGTGGGCLDCPPDAGADAGCVLKTLPILVDEQGGVFDRIHAPIRYEDKPAVLLVDTGSGLTFLQEPLGSPDPVPNAGVFEIGCMSLEVIGRPVLQDPPVNGVPSVGLLGTDQLLKGPTEIDLAGSEIVFHEPGSPFAKAASWPSAPFDVIYGAILAHVALDGMPVRLILDTGSPDTLWVGQNGQPGDIEVMTTDAYGDPLICYQGTVDLTVGASHWTAPVLRCPTFPSWEPPAPDVIGLLGLSSLGNAVVFDTDASLVRVDE